VFSSNPKLRGRAVDRPGLRIHVHDDTRVLDSTLALVEIASGSQPLNDTLCAMCRLVAEISNADVVSVYLREARPDGDVLVMQGNVGFPAHAVGHVELGLFDGLTGVVAERRRPVTVAVAQEDDRYKHVDGIGEEMFPAYLGVPLLQRDEVVGVLVFQRRRPRSFTTSDVTLASSLTAPFSFAIERHGGHRVSTRSSFSGVPVAGGRAAGAALLLPSPNVTALSEPVALSALEQDLAIAMQRLGHALSPRVACALDNLGRLIFALRAHDGRRVSREVVIAALERVPYRTPSGDKDLTAMLAKRRTEIDELWAFLAADATRHVELEESVLVTKRLGTFLAIESVARGAAAIVVEDEVDPDASEIVRAAELPTITGVANLALRGGEQLEVDVARGSVRIVQPATDNTDTRPGRASPRRKAAGRARD
jgi:signal transduction protein with GAF and PtsI domain